MIKFAINGQVVAVEGDALAEAFLAMAPAWVAGSDPAPSPKLAALKSLIKGFLPSLINGMYAEAFRKGANWPAPDFKSAEAKENMIAYAVRYMLSNFAATVEGATFTAEGEEVEGVYVITGILAPVPDMGQETGGTRELAPAPAIASLD